MANRAITIGFVRRGFSQSGGAEAYLKRLAEGVVAAGHNVRLFTTREWPAAQWSFGERVVSDADTPRGFADAVEKAASGCNVLMSLERIWRCDVYRAGDGVHAAWLERRKQSEGALRTAFRRFDSKHRALLKLEQSLFANRGARRVIANSQMVKREIAEFYNYDAAKIDVVHNGVPAAAFANARHQRSQTRAELQLQERDVAALFVGSGWDRKGLHAAVAATREADVRLLVAGRGNISRFAAPHVQFLGEVADLMPIYGAADIFILPTLYDPFSNACLEALAAGLPVITTNANGFAEIISDGVNGTIANDVSACAVALRDWSEATRREPAYAANRQRARAFDISKNVEKTLAVLLQAASAASTSS